MPSKKPFKETQDKNHRSSSCDTPSVVQMVKAVALILHEMGLTEIDYRQGDMHIRLSKKIEVRTVEKISSLPQEEEPISSKKMPPIHKVLSPMVGTVYLSPKPGADPFIKVGDLVKEGQILLIIEAMKVMNPIKASCTGKVQKILVENGSPVEYSEELLWIE